MTDTENGTITPEDDDNLPPREVLERLADLEQRGLLTPEMLRLVAEEAKAHGLRIGHEDPPTSRAPRRRLRLL